ncbi:MAG: alpha/beta fold hydrolase [Thalassobaculales bacterium]
MLRRAGRVIAGITAYRRHPYRRALAEPPALWAEGTTRLLDFGGTGRPLLLIPSLINRAYVLDLAEGHSFARRMAQRFRVFLVDWGLPGPEERTFTLTDYIAGRLEAALDQVLAAAGPPVALGYCMGGTMAVPLAARRGGDLAGLVLLAAPWDFHTGAGDAPAGLPLAARTASWAIEAAGELPTDLLQALFAGLDPFLAVRKFSHFAGLDPACPEAVAFVALEDWLNDGVPLAAAVARECLFGWYGANTPAGGRWRIAGRPVMPAAAAGLPVLAVVPRRDRIVPPQSALALAAALPGAAVLRPPLGHIGMMASARAGDLAWAPIGDWIASIASR